VELGLIEFVILIVNITKPIRRVLVIDDHVDEFLIFEGAVKTAADSIALSRLSSLKGIANDNCKIPDPVSPYINRPHRTGFEWHTLIRGKKASLPVFMYSTASHPNYVKKAYGEGARLYFPKPGRLKHRRNVSLKLFSLDGGTPQKITSEFCKNGQYSVFDTPRES
jgi:DNA-binding NarL/FixJ family response regulator